MKKRLGMVVVFSILICSANLMAKERRGAELVITKTDGQQIRGELVAVKPESLLILGTTSISVGYEEVESIKIIRKSKAGKGFRIGFLIGGTGGLAYDLYQKYSLDYRVDIETFIADITFLGLVVGGIGAATSAIWGKDQTFHFLGKDDQARKVEIQNKLRPLARVVERIP